MQLDEFKLAVDVWLDAHAGELAHSFEGIGTLDEQMAQLGKVRRLTYDAGFMRMGWPERVGGLGGSNLLRAYLGEVLTARDLVRPRSHRAARGQDLADEADSQRGFLVEQRRGEHLGD